MTDRKIYIVNIRVIANRMQKVKRYADKKKSQQHLERMYWVSQKEIKKILILCISLILQWLAGSDIREILAYNRTQHKDIMSELNVQFVIADGTIQIN